MRRPLRLHLLGEFYLLPPLIDLELPVGKRCLLELHIVSVDLRLQSELQGLHMLVELQALR